MCQRENKKTVMKSNVKLVELIQSNSTIAQSKFKNKLLRRREIWLFLTTEMSTEILGNVYRWHKKKSNHLILTIWLRSPHYKIDHNNKWINKFYGLAFPLFSCFVFFSYTFNANTHRTEIDGKQTLKFNCVCVWIQRRSWEYLVNNW